MNVAGAIVYGHAMPAVVWHVGVLLEATVVCVVWVTCVVVCTGGGGGGAVVVTTGGEVVVGLP
jgi:hypothetical protein